jgi:hypothetical protein
MLFRRAAGCSFAVLLSLVMSACAGLCLAGRIDVGIGNWREHRNVHGD